MKVQGTAEFARAVAHSRLRQPIGGREVAVTIALDEAGRLLDVSVRKGGRDLVRLSCRTIARDCLKVGAHWLILYHSHPSGEAAPSQRDVEATRRLARVLKPLGIRLADHVIAAGESHFSFREAALL